MYSRITITGSGTEKQFLDAFTGLIVGSGAGITCTDNYTGHLSDTDPAPSFTLHIGPVDLTFTRDIYNHTGYSMSSDQISTAESLTWGGAIYPTEKTARTWGYDLITNPDKSITILNFGGSEGLTDYPQRKTSIIVLRGAKSGYAGQDNLMYATPTPIFSLPLTLTDNSSITKCDRIPYIYNSNDQTKLHLIRTKMFNVTESENASLEIGTLYDVSAVAVGSVIVFGGKKYYALDAHTIMEVDTVATGG